MTSHRAPLASAGGAGLLAGKGSGADDERTSVNWVIVRAPRSDEMGCWDSGSRRDMMKARTPGSYVHRIDPVTVVARGRCQKTTPFPGQPLDDSTRAS